MEIVSKQITNHMITSFQDFEGFTKRVLQEAIRVSAANSSSFALLGEIRTITHAQTQCSNGKYAPKTPPAQ